MVESFLHTQDLARIWLLEHLFAGWTVEDVRSFGLVGLVIGLMGATLRVRPKMRRMLFWACLVSLVLGVPLFWMSFTRVYQDCEEANAIAAYQFADPRAAGQVPVTIQRCRYRRIGDKDFATWQPPAVKAPSGSFRVF